MAWRPYVPAAARQEMLALYGDAADAALRRAVAGVGVYALERLPDDAGLELIVGALGARAEHGASFFNGDDVQGPGFLAGIAGVALALVAACTDLARDRDRCLLVSLPQVAAP